LRREQAAQVLIQGGAAPFAQRAPQQR
jgi:hypothetical protein